MQASELANRLEIWLAQAEERSEIPAAEADWRRNLLKAAQQIEVCKELLGGQSEQDLNEAAAMAKTGNLELFEFVRELFQRVHFEMRSKGIG